MLELWDLNQPTIPSRSTLYHLDLASIGTASAESLTGYITRLAESHSVYPGVLMEREIAPLVAKQYAGANLHTIYSHTCALNGTGVMASDLVQALNKLTGHNRLHLLTMLSWSKVLPSRALMRSTRAWCPKCYEEQRVNGYEIYEPLLWTLNVVKICPIHQQLLCSRCPHCHQSNLPLAWRSRTGHCFKCEKWLGSSSPSSSEYKDLAETELEWLVWTANAVGELIAAAPVLENEISKERVANGLSNCAKHFSEGNIAKFSRLIQTPTNTVWLWCNGKNLPQLDALVRLCFCLRISVLELLTQDVIEITDSSVRLLPKSCQQRKHRAAIKLVNHEQVRSQLEKVLLDHKLPPPSLEATARDLGYHRETLNRNFKDLCRAISTQYDQYERVRYLNSVDKCCEEVRQVVLRLNSQGVYPSEARVSEHLTKPGHLRHKKVRGVLQETRKSLGLKK
ncbi:TniQ family protein [Leptolyngbya sp. FACHB-671]|uniref:TniQ family protein n=1 Tax=Leptolyngbya sp. FACHB-671 TaxID=2692812 RepID=UPI0016857084|nr:TniQ family protein [Leptolyngbya sp. FACHB-671]MBD2070281.1 TniQ family protein [Leptolyngbya sp. FACHB-671]